MNPEKATETSDAPSGSKRRVRRRSWTGEVVSTRREKTIAVRVELMRIHPKYRKRMVSVRKMHAHDPLMLARDGDVVRIVECRPISKTKHHRLVEVVRPAASRPRGEQDKAHGPRKMLLEVIRDARMSVMKARMPSADKVVMEEKPLEIRTGILRVPGSATVSAADHCVAMLNSGKATHVFLDVDGIAVCDIFEPARRFQRYIADSCSVWEPVTVGPLTDLSIAARLARSGILSTEQTFAEYSRDMCQHQKRAARSHSRRGPRSR